MTGAEDEVIDPHAIPVEQLLSALGQPAHAAALQRSLEAIAWDPSIIETAACDEVPDFIRRFGLTLYFEERQRKRRGSSGRLGPRLRGFRLNRAGDLGSSGYRGALPCGLRFHDTPPQAIARVGRAPDREIVNLDTGAYVWHMPDHRLHVMFSLIDYQVYRVSCFLPEA